MSLKLMFNRNPLRFCHLKRVHYTPCSNYVLQRAFNKVTSLEKATKDAINSKLTVTVTEFDPLITSNSGKFGIHPSWL